MNKGWLRIMLLPAVCIIWMLGWALYNAGPTEHIQKKQALNQNSATSFTNSSEVSKTTTSRM